MFPDVVEPLCRHREAVLQPLTEEEFELFESSSINKISHFAGKEDAYMDYGRFQSSAQGPSEIRQFLYNSLYLRGGWNGSGYERQFIGRRAVAVWISPTINLSDLGADDFATVNLGAPAQDEVIARMCAAIRDLRDVAIATRDVSLE
ncbi:unnamed protein product [Prorocentrum cordatum]|uniref:Uncharacterized protein n=1 Tax=Prorocentrum cordatum TaxID=2364126 RepID=A0ABN9SST2_9DINO|nr:unnamed protein product [Polarella glacialis]